MLRTLGGTGIAISLGTSARRASSRQTLSELTSRVRTCARRIYVGPPWTRLTLCGVLLYGTDLNEARLVDTDIRRADFTAAPSTAVSA
jgi:uncharacterized protein YjbI with pentapeptide repeats